MTHSGIMSRDIPNLKYLRMIGYTVTLVVHTVNMIHLMNIYSGDALDPEVVDFAKNQGRMLTTWNVVIQIFYSILGLSCDVLSLSNDCKDALLKTLKTVRNILFSAIVFPLSMGVFTVFWTMYYYVPTLVIPVKVEKLLPRISNQVVHTFVILVVLWEVVSRSRKTPSAHHLNLALLNIFMTTFSFVSFYTLYETGQFVYPFLNAMWGTPFFIIFMFSCYAIVNLWYFSQWHITEFVWGRDKTEIKKDN